MNHNFEKETDIILLTKILNCYLKEDFNRRLEKFDLTIDQGRLLFKVVMSYKNNIPMTQKDLTEHLHLSKSSISELVERVAKKELIIKERKDKYVYLTPTERGIEIVDTIHDKRIETQEKLYQGFKESEKEEIINLLKRLINNMKGEENEK